MCPAESGSLGLVLLAHTARCIITISFFCIELAYANLRLFSLWFHSCFLAATLVFHSFTQSTLIIVTSSKYGIVAWQVTLTVLLWAIPYLVFLNCTLFLAALVILLEKCETVYLHLRSSRFGAAIREYQSRPPRARLSQDQLGPSSAATGRTLSVPKQSPLFPASTTPRRNVQTSHHRLQRQIWEFIIQILARTDTAVISRVPKQSKVTKPSKASILAIDHPKDHPNHLFSSKESYPVAKATNHISVLKDRLLSKIVECWERFPTPTLTLRALHLSMKPALCSAEESSPKRTSPCCLQNLEPGTGRDIMELDDSQPASPQGDLYPPHESLSSENTIVAGETVVSSSGSSPIHEISQQQSRLHPRPPSRGGIEKKRLPKSRTFTLLSNLTASLSRTSLASFTGSDRMASLQTTASRKTSSSSTLATPMPTRTPTPVTPEVNPLIITTAQPSAYWSGRFMSLQDRFQGESLQEQTLSIFVTAHASKASILAQQRAAYQGRGNLPLSTTTALDRYGTAAIQEAKRLSDEDNRSLRVFLHLEALCGTPEAQKSLHAWQEAYARRMGRSVLLPEGTNPDKGFVARLFSGSGRRSFGGPQVGKETGKGKQSSAMRASIM
ncbi:hypothetical protein CORC01_03749 [Colletotrichum orchidophilum]|uniref:Uncharacterized protein n=1 Tax=Colletotrichum orchidophilum TaxID=1209926 RepID=A0A1G4BHP1_9PEZI|nr:uncharacterized protein CORC01_03749 [Colletotrichum orchidophilum]OHF00921.1 hypothetical protein CORC01_03749 [Colletotrichum orchidophilum]